MCDDNVSRIVYAFQFPNESMVLDFIVIVYRGSKTYQKVFLVSFTNLLSNSDASVNYIGAAIVWKLLTK